MVIVFMVVGLMGEIWACPRTGYGPVVDGLRSEEVPVVDAGYLDLSC